MELNVRPSGEACGAEVTDIDLTKELSESEVTSIREAWLLHHVLSFPDQPMSDDDLEKNSCTLYFGSFGDDPFIGPIPGRTNIVAVKRETQMKKFQYLQIIGIQIGAFKRSLQLERVYLGLQFHQREVIPFFAESTHGIRHDAFRA